VQAQAKWDEIADPPTTDLRYRSPDKKDAPVLAG